MPNLDEKGKADFSLPRSSRIRQNRDYRRIYRQGKRFSNRAGLLYLVKSRRSDVRIGFVATKKIGHAFARNRANRMMKEEYRLHTHDLASRYEAILLASPFLTGASYGEAEKAILALWRKAGILEH